MGRNEIFVAALFYGQAKPTPEDVTKLASILSLSEAVRRVHFLSQRIWPRSDLQKKNITERDNELILGY
jgi:cyanate lyase